MSRFATLIFSFYLLLASFIASPKALAASAADIKTALDSPEGVEFSKSDAWKKVDGKIYDKKVSSVGGSCLEGTSPTAAATQKIISFSITVYGAGVLYFDFHDSLDFSNDSEFCVYEEDIESGRTFTKTWEEDWGTYDGWWEPGEYELHSDTYTHTVTFAIKGPLKGDSYVPPDDKIKNKAWLDNFRWMPDNDVKILEFFPSPGIDNTYEFEEEIEVSLESGYDNIYFYYTTDGKTPTTSSKRFNPSSSDDIKITKTTTIKAIAMEEDGGKLNDNNTFYEVKYILTAISTPVFLVPKQPDFDVAELQITSTTEGTSIYYTTNGQDPILTNGIPGSNTERYNQPLTLRNDVTVKAIAWKSGVGKSAIRSYDFEQADAPNYSIVNSTDNFDGTITLEIIPPVDDNITIKYQVNNEEAKIYSTPLTISKPSTIRFQTQRRGKLHSDIIEREFKKLNSPTYIYKLDSQAAAHPYFDKDQTVTLEITAPPGAVVRYQINDEPIEEYSGPLTISKTCTVRFQAQELGKLHSDVVTLKFYKTSEEFTLTEPADLGWSLFFLPGHISQENSDMLIAQLQPIAYDSQKKIYFRPTLLLGGESYWVFKADGETRGGTSFPIYPIDGVTLPARTWLLSGIPEGTTLPLPADVQAQAWNGQTFALPQTTAELPIPAWLYNSGSKPIDIP